jgi:dTDP-4-amino-4,6-dideoxygalactose transaminase
MRAYKGSANANGSLQATITASERVLTLPLWAGMTADDVTTIASAISRIGEHRSGRPYRAGENGAGA